MKNILQSNWGFSSPVCIRCTGEWSYIRSSGLRKCFRFSEAFPHVATLQWWVHAGGCQHPFRHLLHIICSHDVPPCSSLWSSIHAVTWIWPLARGIMALAGCLRMWAWACCGGLMVESVGLMKLRQSIFIALIRLFFTYLMEVFLVLHD